LGASQKAFLDALGARRVLVVADGSETLTNALVDLDGKFFCVHAAARQSTTMLVRPDLLRVRRWSDIADLNQLIDDLQSDLERNGPAACQAQSSVQFGMHLTGVLV